MKPSRYRELMNWDKSLKIGDLIQARFTNCFNSFCFKGKITKLNDNTLRVIAINCLTGYDANKEFLIRRFCDFQKWTSQNGAFPIVEKIEVLK